MSCGFKEDRIYVTWQALPNKKISYSCPKSGQVSTTLYQLEDMVVMYQTIPREYQPKQLKASSASLTEEFVKECNKMFFKHLQKVITNNQIELQLHTSALTSIIVQTEVYLSTTPNGDH